jgi:Tfp pilus assembly protein PilX
MALFSTLLFLLAMSVGLTVIFEQAFLSNRMSINFYERAIAWEKAETALRLGEASIHLQALASSQDDSETRYHVDLLEIDFCGKKRYRIKATGKHRQSEVVLMSDYEYLPISKKPQCQKEIIDRRVFFRRIK